MTKAPWFSSPAISIPASALADPTLKLRTKVILASIAAIAGPDGRTRPISKGVIAAACGLPATNLARELRELASAGWLEVSHQPGSSSVYQLKEPHLKDDTMEPVRKSEVSCSRAMTLAGAARRMSGRLAATPVTTRAATVVRVEDHDNSWLVSFSLPDNSTVSTIFQGGAKPCEIGDTANVDVRDWQGRKSIAGGAACGVHWVDHHPAPSTEIKEVELVVSELNRYATPAGRVFVSLLGRGEQFQAQASLPDTNVPRGIEVGSLIRISRRDGGLIAPDIHYRNILPERNLLPQLEFAGEAYVIERLSQGRAACMSQ
jgi:hypothetical protein